MRREWIEILYKLLSPISSQRSPSMRREWIEIPHVLLLHVLPAVSLHAEGVD